jgi:hypothetical protein
MLCKGPAMQQLLQVPPSVSGILLHAIAALPHLWRAGPPSSFWFLSWQDGEAQAWQAQAQGTWRTQQQHHFVR